MAAETVHIRGLAEFQAALRLAQYKAPKETAVANTTIAKKVAAEARLFAVGEGRQQAHFARFIVGRGEAWDVESNVAIGFEVRRRITNRKGDTYDDDMITVTGNAAASIALRNAVFKAVPSSFWKPIYQKCRQVIAGDAKTFAARRDDMLKAFMVAGVTPDRLCAGIGLKGVQDITLDHMATLVGVLNAIKEGETTIEEAFPEGGGLGAPQPSVRKSQQPAAAPVAPPVAESPAAAASPVPETPAAATADPRVGTIVEVKEKSGAFMVKLSTGFICATRDANMADAADKLREAGRTVELVTKPARDAKYAPHLEAIEPVPEAGA